MRMLIVLALTLVATVRANDPLSSMDFNATAIRNVTRTSRNAQTRDWILSFQDEICDRAVEGYYDLNRNISTSCCFPDVMDDVLEYFMDRDFDVTARQFSRNTTGYDYDFCTDRFILPGTFRDFMEIQISWNN